jgi:hypothetical protein
MPDTIELLETIGRDASLRHASVEKLTCVLEEAQASEALKAAVISGDGFQLSKELGHKQMDPPQSSQTHGHPGEEPDHDCDDKPNQPPPDQGEHSPKR